jgi:voltage-gated sodium channel
MNEATIISAEPLSPLQRFVENDWFKRIIVVLIVVNAIFLGMETMRELPANLLDTLFRINRAILGVFVIELILRISAHRLAFFRDPWSLFDLVIVIAALIAPSGPLQVLRSLRVLRALRLVSTVPSLRRVVDGLLSAVPGIASVMVLLVLMLYVAAVMATLLFRDVAPDYFGHLGLSLFSLFQIMTLEGWPDIAAEVMASQRWAWVFFVGYIMFATFMVLNLVIGIVVSAIQSRIESETAQTTPTDPVLTEELNELRREISEFRKELARRS